MPNIAKSPDESVAHMRAMREDARFRIMTSHDMHATYLKSAAQFRRIVARTVNPIDREIAAIQARRCILTARKWRNGTWDGIVHAYPF